MDHLEDCRDEIAATSYSRRVKALPISLTPSTRKAMDERERARRVLVYSHQVATTGRLHPHLLWEWAYQPTEEEIDALIASLVDTLRQERDRARRNRARSEATK